MLERLSGFTTWLPKHSGLVSEIKQPSDNPTTAAVEAMLQLALQLCSDHETRQPPRAAAEGMPGGADVDTSTSTAAAAAAAAHGSQPLPDAPPLPLRLSHVTTNSVISPAILRLLAQTGLPEDLTLALQAEQITAPVCGALAGLSSLVRLQTSMLEDDDMPLQLAAAVGQLRQLTHLDCMNVGPAAARLLPVSLESLNLTQYIEPVDGDVFDVSHLTSLSSVVFVKMTGRPLAVTLPAQPLCATLCCCIKLVGGYCFKALKLACSTAADMQILLALQNQPHLGELVLVSDDAYRQVQEEDRLRHAAALGQLTALTRLELHQLCVPLLSHLSQLRQLRHLHVERACQQPLADVLQLSALTQLTSLVFEGEQALDDVGAVALASALTRLQMLHLASNGIQTWSLVPAVARLTGLRSLKLWPYPKARLTPVLLQQLSTLTGLTSLTLPVQHCSQESQQQLLARLPGLTEIASSPDTFWIDP